MIELQEALSLIRSNKTYKKIFKEVYKKYFGHTSVDRKVPLHEKMIYRLASMTKPITTVATLILIERGLLSLDDKVEDFIPQFKR